MMSFSQLPGVNKIEGTPILMLAMIKRLEVKKKTEKKSSNKSLKTSSNYWEKSDKQTNLGS